MTHTHWLSIDHHDLQPIAQHYLPWFPITCTALLASKVVNHGELCWAGAGESWCAKLRQWFYIMVSYAEPVVANHVGPCWASGCVSRSPWLATNCSALPTMIPNHLHSITHHDSEPQAQHSKSWFATTVSVWQCVILSQWLWVIVCYAEPVVVNHGELCWATGVC
jgi:hypothetical protein